MATFAGGAAVAGVVIILAACLMARSNDDAGVAASAAFVVGFGLFLTGGLVAAVLAVKALAA